MLKFIQPEGWKPAKGFANAVAARGTSVHIAGQIGWDENQEFVSDEFIPQMEQALKNIAVLIDTAGGKIEDIVRITWYVVDKAEYVSKQREVGEVYRKILGRHFPAMTMIVVKDLVEDRALIEIEATAVIPD